jgi:hypothetical protein
MDPRGLTTAPDHNSWPPYAARSPPRSSAAERTERWKYIRTYDIQDKSRVALEKLCDLQRDALETRNLAGNPAAAERQRELSRELDRWRAAIRGPIASQVGRGGCRSCPELHDLGRARLLLSRGVEAKRCQAKRCQAKRCQVPFWLSRQFSTARAFVVVGRVDWTFSNVAVRRAASGPLLGRSTLPGTHGLAANMDLTPWRFGGRSPEL